jgi:tripeptidyl-peptidase-1
MMLCSFWLIAAFAVSCTLAAIVTDHPSKVKEVVTPPRGWVKDIPAPPDHVIQLNIGLPQAGFSILEQHLYEVSDPFHERYGQHLTKAEVESLVAPHPHSVDAVKEWLASHGLLEDRIVRSPAGDWLSVRVPVSLAEKMLDTVRLIIL